MTETTPTSNSSAPASPQKAKLARWASLVVGIVFLIVGAVKLLAAFSLPACNSQTVSDAVRSIYKSKDVELTKLSDLKTVTSSFSEKTCQGSLETASETGTFDYKIYWEGWSARVIITAVDAKPRT